MNATHAEKLRVAMARSLKRISEPSAVERSKRLHNFICLIYCFPWNRGQEELLNKREMSHKDQGVNRGKKLKKISQPLLEKKPPRKPTTRPRTVQKQMNVKDEGDQRAINTSHVQAKSNENGIGFVKLLGRYRAGSIAMYIS
ncbi:hypothetical protein Bca52824_012520 [Brassica carinata]|uniref:Uncharacterized protein n=1 Tax=Brassica carinata TaxID=52824 RepID=A0A8X7VXT4_BRACI|nr:hypothetical protein Bca52824_012520 [Brassica carinata]